MDLAAWLLKGIEAQCDVEKLDGAVVVIGPLDLDELADYLRRST